jgi:pimeloyl-ACP methyl ester carboxylesterase
MEKGGSSGLQADTVVLVPGGFLGPWVWEDVEARLGSVGLGTRTVGLASVPETDAASAGGFDDDVARVRAVLDALESPAILCGHSYAGAVITQAAAGPHPAVGRLIYLAAAAPDTGQSLADLAPQSHADKTAGPDDASDQGEQVHVRPDGTIELTRESAIAALFNDCTVKRADRAADRLRPMNPAVNAQAVTGAAWRELPASYVRPTRDQMPELVSADFLAIVDEVVEIPTGHCPQWSHPELTANLIIERSFL